MATNFVPDKKEFLDSFSPVNFSQSGKMRRYCLNSKEVLES